MISHTHFPAQNTRHSHTPASSRQNDLDSAVSAQIADSLDYQIIEKNFSEYVSLHPEEDQSSTEADVYEKPTPARNEMTTVSSKTQIDIAQHETLEFNVSVEGENITLKIDTLRWMHTEFASQTTAATPAKKSDPLVFDLNADGILTSGLAAGVKFDLDADGHTETISAPTDDNAMLAWDKNHNGKIDDGSELFGDQTGFANGFEALAAHDTNQDSQIDKQDDIFNQLSLLHWDARGNQQVSALNQQMSSINLNYQNQRSVLTHQDEIAQTGSATNKTGNKIALYDLLLNQSE